MAEAWLLLLAVVSCFLAMSWFALSMKAHWRQLRARAERPAALLRSSAVVALMVSFLLCLTADHPSIAVLVWVMALTGSALSVAMLLAWRPRWLAALIVWLPGR